MGPLITVDPLGTAVNLSWDAINDAPHAAHWNGAPGGCFCR